MLVLLSVTLLLGLIQAQTVTLFVGTAELESHIPATLSQLFQQSKNFCTTTSSETIGVQPHRCQWVVAGSLLNALPPTTQKQFLQQKHIATGIFDGITKGKSGDSRSTTHPTILFLLHDAKIDKVNGGLIGSIEAAIGLQSLGYTVHIAILQNSVDFISQNFPLASELLLPYDHFQDEISIKSHDYNIVVATYFPTLWMAIGMVERSNSDASSLPPRVIYFAQDYEPLFDNLPKAVAAAASLSYVYASNLVTIVSYSSWVLSTIKKNHGVSGKMVSCHPRLPLISRPKDSTFSMGTNDKDIVVVAMIRPATPRRAPVRTLSTLYRLWKKISNTKNARSIKIVTFGCTHDEMQSLASKTWKTRYLSSWWSSKSNCAWPWLKHVGLLNHTQVHELFQQSDIFLDVSTWQAYGFSSQESMLNGVVPVVVGNGGVTDFVDDKQNSFVVDNEDGAVDALTKLIVDKTGMLRRMQNEAKQKISARTRKSTALSWELMLSPFLSSNLS
jgi:glycosyltransferase involved in cell wall biosynthesis